MKEYAASFIARLRKYITHHSDINQLINEKHNQHHAIYLNMALLLTLADIQPRNLNLDRKALQNIFINHSTSLNEHLFLLNHLTEEILLQCKARPHIFKQVLSDLYCDDNTSLNNFADTCHKIATNIRAIQHSSVKPPSLDHIEQLNTIRLIAMPTLASVGAGLTYFFIASAASTLFLHAGLGSIFIAAAGFIVINAYQHCLADEYENDANAVNTIIDIFEMEQSKVPVDVRPASPLNLFSSNEKKETVDNNKVSALPTKLFKTCQHFSFFNPETKLLENKEVESQGKYFYLDDTTSPLELTNTYITL